MRLAAQANEADLYKHYKIADRLTNVLVKYSEAGLVRNEKEDEEYEYSKEELLEDIEAILWDATTRVSDYYDELPDGRDLDDFVKTFADEFLAGLDNLTHSKIGKHEKPTPGETEDDDEKADEVVHWEIKFLNDNEDADPDEDDRPGFVLEESDDEEEKEEKEKKEKD